MDNINNFEEYDFKAEFEGEILKKDNSRFYGIVKDQGEYHTITWNKVGRVLSASNSLAKFELFNLSPKIKPWYEIKENFPCVVVQVWDSDRASSCDKIRIATSYNKEDGYLNCYEYIDPVENFRLATKEEHIKLYLKEK